VRCRWCPHLTLSCRQCPRSAAWTPWSVAVATARPTPAPAGPPTSARRPRCRATSSCLLIAALVAVVSSLGLSSSWPSHSGQSSTSGRHPSLLSHVQQRLLHQFLHPQLQQRSPLPLPRPGCGPDGDAASPERRCQHHPSSHQMPNHREHRHRLCRLTSSSLNPSQPNPSPEGRNPSPPHPQTT